MDTTDVGNWGGWKAQQRTSDPGALAAWRAQYTYGDKTAIMEQLALACGLGTELVQHWARHDRLNPAAVEFFDTCKYCHTHVASTGRPRSIASGMVMGTPSSSAGDTSK